LFSRREEKLLIALPAHQHFVLEFHPRGLPQGKWVERFPRPFRPTTRDPTSLGAPWVPAVSPPSFGKGKR
jgi:hypothetical protein